MSLDKDDISRGLLGHKFANSYVEPIKEFDNDFTLPLDYKEGLPDLQNDVYEGIREDIEQVGIHNFKLPLKFQKKDGSLIELETKVTGTVSLAADSRGINMSRIMRTFYEYKDNVFNLDKLEEILQSYKKKIGGYTANIMLNISYPIIQQSMRTGLEGYQYYNVTLEGKLDIDGNFKKFIHFDFVYSSACPCSKELAEHARKYRNRDGIPHSQRSTTRISIEYNDFIWIEDLQEICLDALQTETQVMVLREDEQAFAELNGAYPKFVEDAARLLYRQLNTDVRILDFKARISHQESLHSHNAISVIIKGVENGFNSSVSIEELNSLVR
jgi:GTP cyclohydrolase I